MSPPILPVVIENAELLIAEALPRVIAKQASAQDVFELCTQMRRRGIAELLLGGTPDDLLRQLSYSGRALLHALPTIPANRRAAGEQRPFLDALAAGDTECAESIARMCPATATPGEELEEDFLYMSSLMHSLLDRGDLVGGRVARYQAIVGEDEDPRLAVLHALVARDAPAFEAALTLLTEDISRHYRELHLKMAIADEEAETEGKISSEAIALVRLARRLGMQVADDYRMVPRIVWRATWRPDAAYAWMSP